ncbi:DDE-type integrase/transposase/recombinase [Ruegeria sp.]|uniref:DDE-type integrase/transposase/recombinase n=1 Tax=Ruegeria sp. TaxID=1879320 RepID=UPI003AFFACD6
MLVKSPTLRANVRDRVTAPRGWMKLKSVNGARITLYRAMDKHGNTLGFMHSERRNKPAAQELVAQLIERNDLARQFVSILAERTQQVCRKACNFDPLSGEIGVQI